VETEISRGGGVDRDMGGAYLNECLGFGSKFELWVGCLEVWMGVGIFGRMFGCFGAQNNLCQNSLNYLWQIIYVKFPEIYGTK
jgi:hypothetical protein